MSPDCSCGRAGPLLSATAVETCCHSQEKPEGHYARAAWRESARPYLERHSLLCWPLGSSGLSLRALSLPTPCLGAVEYRDLSAHALRIFSRRKGRKRGNVTSHAQNMLGHACIFTDHSRKLILGLFAGVLTVKLRSRHVASQAGGGIDTTMIVMSSLSKKKIYSTYCIHMQGITICRIAGGCELTPDLRE